ncbi:MAG: TorF family putative porin [Bacteroidales bacterium]
MRKKLLFILVFNIFGVVTNLIAQDNLSISTDIQSRYVWRGQALGANVPSVQPGISYKWKNINIGAWGAFSTSQLTSQELDIYISYTFLKQMFTVIVTDYSFPQDNTTFQYFDYDKNSTNHVFEVGLIFNGLEKLPLNASLYMNFYGADAKDIDGNNNLSTYGEISYNPTCEKLNTDFSLFAGFAFNGGYTIESTVTNPIPTEIKGFYNNKGFAFINLGIGATKTLKITESFSLPINTKLIFNPDANKAYFTVGTGISL